MREKSAPGPIYNPDTRVLSREKSSRNIKFGTGPARYNDEPEGTIRRVPIQTQHPGPQTYDPNSIRNAINIQSKQRSVTGIKFGTGVRYCNADVKSLCPSPAEYDPDAIRRGILLTKANTGFIRFGTARKKDFKCHELPGPQTYNPDGIRRGIMLTKSKIPSVRFGEAPSKLKVVNECLPGPQDYDTENIRKGLHALSTKKRPLGMKFTTGPKYSSIEEREQASKPGPASYVTPSALGPQCNSRFKSQPCVSFGCR